MSIANKIRSYLLNAGKESNDDGFKMVVVSMIFVFVCINLYKFGVEYVIFWLWELNPKLTL